MALTMHSQNTQPSVEAVAARLVALCEKNQFLQAQRELYHPNIERIEVDGSRLTGLENTLAREKKFLAGLKQVNTHISNLSVIDQYFSLVMSVEITFAASGVVKSMREICVYKVADGKIVFEQFFR